MVWHWTCEWKAGDTSLLSGEWLIRCVGRHRGIDSNHFQHTCAAAVRRCFYFVFFLRLWRLWTLWALGTRITDLIYCDYCRGKDREGSLFEAVLEFSHAHAAVCGLRFAVCGLRYAVCGLQRQQQGRLGHQLYYTILYYQHYQHYQHYQYEQRTTGSDNRRRWTSKSSL